MGRELQKKKNRSSLPKVRQKKKSKHLNIRSNPIVAANWSHSQTLSQNYRRLGLTSKLNARAGGTEPRLDNSKSPRLDSLSIKARAQAANTLIPTTARITRDPITGAITRVIQSPSPSENRNPLNDPLNALDSDKEDVLVKDGEDQDTRVGGNVGIIGELEATANAGDGKRRPRVQSRREEEWIERLVERWGDDLKSMFRDRRLNPQQQTEGDLRRRIRKWRERREQGGEVNHEIVDARI